MRATYPLGGRASDALLLSYAAMASLTLGLLAGSHKENERRLPIHPRHLRLIEDSVRRRITLECGYGEPFGFADEDLAPLVAGMRPRNQVVTGCDIVVVPKPMPADLLDAPEGAVLWGWMHCVQDEEITQLAIDRGLTLIAWEEMHHWSRDGSFDLHVFHKNNELAGYCSVIHALQLAGVTGQYGRELRAAVVGFGATGRGAVTGLVALGIQDVSVLTRREAAAVAAPIHSVRLVTYERDPDAPGQTLELDSEDESVADFLAGHDVVVNCMLQDTDAPLILVSNDELKRFHRGTQFVDVSADDGMGFEWSRPTSFDRPVFTIGDGMQCYAVDHSPSLLWDSATWEISQSLIPHLPTAMSGLNAWTADATLSRAIEISAGVVRNPKILSFQGRSAEFPHAKVR
jgi:alanine dehydrogenase